MIKATTGAPLIPKRVVILGASGFIGSHLVTHFRKLGIETLAFASADIDLTSIDANEKLANVVDVNDTLVFASCITRDKGKDDLPTLMRNLKMAEQVGMFIEKYGCAHVIYFSSDAVYKDAVTLVRENSEKDPGGLYGITHVVREKMMEHSCSKKSIPLAILRPCAVYGKGDTHNGYGPNRFLRIGLAGQTISLFGEGEEKRDHIFVGDVCRLVELCASMKAQGVLNLATGKAHSFKEVAQTVAQVLNKPICIEGSVRKTPITHRAFDITQLLQLCPTFSFLNLSQGLQYAADNETEK